MSGRDGVGEDCLCESLNGSAHLTVPTANFRGTRNRSSGPARCRATDNGTEWDNHKHANPKKNHSGTAGIAPQPPVGVWCAHWQLSHSGDGVAGSQTP